MIRLLYLENNIWLTIISRVLCVSLVYLDENKIKVLRKEILVARSPSIWPHEILTPFIKMTGDTESTDSSIYKSSHVSRNTRSYTHPLIAFTGNGRNDMESWMLQNQPHNTKWSKVLHFTHGYD